MRQAMAAAVALVAMLAALTGCAGKDAKFQPRGSVTTAGSTPAVPRAQFTFPPDFRVDFAASATKTPEEVAAIQAFEDFWRAYWYAMVTRGQDKRYLDYFAPTAAPLTRAPFTKSVQGARRERLRQSGTVRVFNVRALSSDKDSAFVVGCGDEDGQIERDMRTGEIQKQPNLRLNRYKMRIGMVRVADGRWLIRSFSTAISPHPDARECQA